MTPEVVKRLLVYTHKAKTKIFIHTPVSFQLIVGLLHTLGISTGCREQSF